MAIADLSQTIYPGNAERGEATTQDFLANKFTQYLIQEKAVHAVVLRTLIDANLLTETQAATSFATAHALYLDLITAALDGTDTSTAQAAFDAWLLTGATS